MKNKTKITIASSLVFGSFLLAGIASAAGMPGRPMGGRGMMGHPPGVVGTVSAISGTTLTVTSKGFGRNATTTPATTYTVDASGSTVMKSGATGTVGSIAVGDMVMVSGTLNGTNVTATSIRDGMFGRGMGMNPGKSPAASIITGNGQPVIGGAVTAITGSSLTVTNKSNVTYTIDATNAVIEKGNATSSVSNISAGDNVLVQGTVNGNAVTASSVSDLGVQRQASTTNAHIGGVRGFLGNIGGFFKHMFGFF